MLHIPVAGPWITEKEIRFVTDAVANAWYANANSYNERFERAFAKYIGTRYAVTLPSCTSAIHLALLALGVGPGDEVIVPDVTWIATAAPIVYVGATPVFADIDSDTWCLSAESLSACITSRTKAVIPVDLYGGIPDMDAICRIARKHGLAVIEDAAEAIGSEYKGRRAGSLGDTGVFSFHGSKTLTTGEGGMLVTDREDIRERVLVLRDHGRRPGDKVFYNSEVGYKYKMSSMQAALGLAQLERVEDLIARKREIFGWYRDRLKGQRDITLNCEPPVVKNSYWMVTAVIAGQDTLIPKYDVMNAMAIHGIDCRPFFHPLSSLPAFETSESTQRARHRNGVSYRVSPCGINLPSGFNLTEKMVDDICASLRAILATAKPMTNAA